MTHYVSLIGGPRLGAFFAERITNGPTLLCKEPLSPPLYSHLADRPLTWHPFDRHRHKRLFGWELKPYAIMHSRFQEILYLDADNVPVVDPTYLFDTPE